MKFRLLDSYLILRLPISFLYRLSKRIRSYLLSKYLIQLNINKTAQLIIRIKTEYYWLQRKIDEI